MSEYNRADLEETRRRQDARVKEARAKSSLAPATLSACGHPGLPNNLKHGNCGTCTMAAELEGMSRESSTPKLRRILRALANQFRSGNMIYDTNGKSFLEWEKTMRTQAFPMRARRFAGGRTKKAGAPAKCNKTKQINSSHVLSPTKT